MTGRTNENLIAFGSRGFARSARNRFRWRCPCRKGSSEEGNRPVESSRPQVARRAKFAGPTAGRGLQEGGDAVRVHPISERNRSSNAHAYQRHFGRSDIGNLRVDRRRGQREAAGGGWLSEYPRRLQAHDEVYGCCRLYPLRLLTRPLRPEDGHGARREEGIRARRGKFLLSTFCRTASERDSQLACKQPPSRWRIAGSKPHQPITDV